jgi:hypothetical protein
LAGDGRLIVAVAERGSRRAALLAQAVPGTSSVPTSGQLGTILAEVVSEVAGTVLANGIRMDLVRARRQEELDQRIVPGIPSDIQFAYLGLLALGLMSLTVARSWWARLWPQEQRAAYARPAGYRAALIVRGMIFVLLFLPPVAPFAFVWGALSSLLGWLMLPLRRRNRRATGASATSE